jgi:hypothetical protein
VSKDMFLKKQEIFFYNNKKNGWDRMGCPHYEDFTRNCIQFFPHVMEYPSFGTCDSDNYRNCLAYIALLSGFRCKYQNLCLEDLVLHVPILAKFFIEDDRTIQLFKSMTEKYCSSEQNHTQCACFELLEQGIHPPVELLPDGKKFRLRDLIFKREIIIE